MQDEVQCLWLVVGSQEGFALGLGCLGLVVKSVSVN